MTHNTQSKDPDPATEELRFLARSRHRMALLRALTEEPRTRQELEAETGISQPTLGRIIGDFEERHWLSNEHNGAYSLSPVGAALATELEDVLSVLTSSDRISAVADSLPMDEIGVDIKAFASADVIQPTERDPLAHMRRFDELAVSAEHVWMFSNVLACAPGSEEAEAHQSFLDALDLVVVTADGLEATLDDSELRMWLEERLASGALDLYKYDRSAPYLLGLFDDTVGLVPIDESGMPTGLVVTDEDIVHDWAKETLDGFQGESSEVLPDTLTEGNLKPG